MAFKQRIWLKQGVIGKLNRQTRKGFGKVAKLYEEKERDMYVTSLEEGVHAPGSLHYDGGAFDIFDPHKYVSKDEIISALGWRSFDVVEYDWGYHIEYDPK